MFRKQTFCSQALPCDLSVFEGKPSMKEDHCKGIILATFPLVYISFDNVVAAGKYNPYTLKLKHDSV